LKTAAEDVDSARTSGGPATVVDDIVIDDKKTSVKLNSVYCCIINCVTVDYCLIALSTYNLVYIYSILCDIVNPVVFDKVIASVTY
jgi:hypothetical protein